jgi:hypothetical protein
MVDLAASTPLRCARRGGSPLAARSGAAPRSPVTAAAAAAAARVFSHPRPGYERFSTWTPLHHLGGHRVKSLIATIRMLQIAC